jgi:2-keto-4-pentenoate hydratase/2-oxohepta-3-ene-1,7-dioic acid hydratase in catechol pathway
MKLATFEVDGRERIGVVKDDAIVDLSGDDLPTGMIELITRWPTLKDRFSRIVQNTKPRYQIGDVHLLAPVPRPQKILAIGLNYADHIAESGAATPERQIWFSKLPNAVNGPYDAIQMPKASSAIDYEAELVFIIGKRCRHVVAEKAPEVIFGYAAGNDISVRDWQFHTPQWLIGKSFDSHAPFGPWIVTADEIGDPHALGIRCLVNGETRQSSNTKNLVFNCFDQIAYLSQAMTLEPGDVVFTGTPGGVGQSMKPPKLLKSGDTVRVEIDRIGFLSAKMVPED